VKLSELIAQHPHLDMDVEVEEGTIIMDAVLLIRDVDPETRHDSLGLWCTDGLGGIIQYGMICAGKYDLERLMWHGAQD
jgi:hypothetical protein